MTSSYTQVIYTLFVCFVFICLFQVDKSSCCLTNNCSCWAFIFQLWFHKNRDMYRDGNFAVVDGGYFCTCEYAGNHFLDTMWYNANSIFFVLFLIIYLFNLWQYLRKIKLFGYRVFLIYAVRFSLWSYDVDWMCGSVLHVGWYGRLISGLLMLPL